MDIGPQKLTGSAGYDETTQTYAITGAGSNIWFNRDEFHFPVQKTKGDFMLTADFAFIGDTQGGRSSGSAGDISHEPREAVST